MMTPSIVSFKVFLKVNLGLILRKNPIPTSVGESYFLIPRKAELVCRVSNIPLFSLEYNPYFSWDIIWLDSRIKGTYSLLVTLYTRQSLNTFLYSSMVGISLP